jgi:hypothetical protein
MTLIATTRSGQKSVIRHSAKVGQAMAPEHMQPFASGFHSSFVIGY